MGRGPNKTRTTKHETSGAKRRLGVVCARAKGGVCLASLGLVLAGRPERGARLAHKLRNPSCGSHAPSRSGTRLPQYRGGLPRPKWHSGKRKTNTHWMVQIDALTQHVEQLKSASGKNVKIKQDSCGTARGVREQCVFYGFIGVFFSLFEVFVVAARLSPAGTPTQRV